MFVKHKNSARVLQLNVFKNSPLHDSDSYWKFKFRDTNLTEETWQVEKQFNDNIEIRKHHLTICNYSGDLTSQSSQCHQISCFSSWMSYLATNFQSGHIIIRLNIQGSCQIPNSTWSQNRPRIVLPLTLNLFLFFLSALFTKASFRILWH